VTEVARTLSVPVIKNIVYATDYSSASQAALPYLRALALRHGATVHVVHVMPLGAWSSVPMDTLPAMEKDRQDAEAAMQELLAGDTFRELALTSTVERGAVWDVLSSIAEERRADLLVLGTHGRGGLSKLVLGSTAEEVFRRATCPVLTVGPHTTDGARAEGAGAPVLFATDFSPGSEHALPYARLLARETGSPLLLVHAVNFPVTSNPASMESVAVDPTVTAEILAEIVSAAKRQLGELLPEEEARELKAEYVVECAGPAELILGVAEQRKAGIIVMGAHKASAHSVASHLPWATASEVVRAARCPVLTVRS
jgi:nucleotide-binding universal stress UspA family protein